MLTEHCDYCGKDNEAGLHFCSGCATMLTPPDQAQIKEHQLWHIAWFVKLPRYKTDARLWKWIALVLLGPIALLLLLQVKIKSEPVLAHVGDWFVAVLRGEVRSEEVFSIGLIFTWFIIISAIVAVVIAWLIVCAIVIARTRQRERGLKI